MYIPNAGLNTHIHHTNSTQHLPPYSPPLTPHARLTCWWWWRLTWWNGCSDQHKPFTMAASMSVPGNGSLCDCHTAASTTTTTTAAAAAAAATAWLLLLMLPRACSSLWEPAAAEMAKLDGMETGSLSLLLLLPCYCKQPPSADQ